MWRYYMEKRNKRPEIKNVYSLSPMQEGMLFHYLVGQGSSAYFEQLSYNIVGKMNTELLNKSLNMLIERYDIFRTVFIYERIGTPQQVVLKERKFDLFFEDISYMNDSKMLKYLEDYKVKDRQRGFNLSKDIPMRVAFFKTGHNVNKLIWSFHHIIMDGWSLGIVLKEFFQIYQSLSDAETVTLPNVYQYGNYIKWLMNKILRKHLITGENIWMDMRILQLYL